LATAAVPVYPLAGVLAYVALAYGFPRYQQDYQFMLQLYVLEWVAGLTLFGWIIRHFRLREWPNVISSRLAWSLAALIVWIGLSSVGVVWRGTPWGPSWKHHPIGFVNAFVLFLVSAQVAGGAGAWTLIAFVFGSALSARAALVPSQVPLEGDISALIVMAIPLLVAGAWVNAGHVASYLLTPGESRASGKSPRIMASLVAMLVMLAEAAYLAYVLFETRNRGAAVAAVVALLIAWLVSKQKAIWFALASPIAPGAVAYFLKTDYWRRFEDIWKTGSGLERLDIWDAGLQMFREHPVLGVGPGHFPVEIGRINLELEQLGPHNSAIAMLSETGLPGLTLFTAFFLAATLTVWWTRRQSLDGEHRVFAGALLVALAAYLTTGCFIARPTQALPYVLVGAGVALDQRRRESAHAQPVVSRARRTLTHGHLFVFAAVFTAFAVYGSLVPLNYTSISLSDAVDRFRQIPFLQLGVQSRADWVANVLLFVPLGFFWLGTMSLDRPRWQAVLLAPAVLQWGAALAVGLEFTQLWFPDRTVSQNDIAAESLGTLVGVCVWIAVGQPVAEWLRTLWNLRPTKLFEWLLQLYFAGFLIYSLMPFDVTISVGELYEKCKEGKVVFVPFSYSYGSAFQATYDLVSDVLVFVPIGALVATAFTSAQRPVRSASQSLVLGLLVAVAVESSQFLIYSRFTDVTDVLTGTAGQVMGAWLVSRWMSGRTESMTLEPDRSRLGYGWVALSVAYACALVAGFWYPFDFTSDTELIKTRLDGFFRTPFEALYRGSEFNAITQVLARVLLFCPLGAMLAMAVLPMRLPIAVQRFVLCVLLVFGSGLAFGIELGQVLQPSHVADFTEVVICAVGAGLGLFVTPKLKSRH
jgi:glycopeptide antibiotics resistance protein